MLAATSRLGRQLQELITALQNISARHALIGGLALAPYNVIRATQDIDLLVDLEEAEKIEVELTRLGYRCLHRSDDAGNYVRGDERVDLLYAHRPIAKRLLGGAIRLSTTLGEVQVISKEGLAAFKLQGLVNDPRRTQDLEDLRMLVKRNRGQLDLTELREYFRLFNRESLLDELLREVD